MRRALTVFPTGPQHARFAPEGTYTAIPSGAEDRIAAPTCTPRTAEGGVSIRSENRGESGEGLAAATPEAGPVSPEPLAMAVSIDLTARFAGRAASTVAGLLLLAGALSVSESVETQALALIGVRTMSRRPRRRSHEGCVRLHAAGASGVTSR